MHLFQIRWRMHRLVPESACQLLWSPLASAFAFTHCSSWLQVQDTSLCTIVQDKVVPEASFPLSSQSLPPLMHMARSNSTCWWTSLLPHLKFSNIQTVSKLHVKSCRLSLLPRKNCPRTQIVCWPSCNHLDASPWPYFHLVRVYHMMLLYSHQCFFLAQILPSQLLLSSWVTTSE